ncbi:diaminopimelate decarboxylase [bacterium (Candidatus Howlettbacteria) CG_4_10_14_0_8_um_filter_40_9]|nr:MAG: diaminopimelate decarboxylase [bacterium (Candidatus Howlettbacteria) CG_4_10_14_0_8_um_filter_40_9]
MTYKKQSSITFGSDDRLIEIAKKYGTPLMIHDENSYRRYAEEALAVPNSFGLTVRYAMKANSHKAVLNILDNIGIHIDASSYWEVKRAIAAGIALENIQLTSQETLTEERLKEIVGLGVIYNCTSLTQLKMFAKTFSNTERTIAVRINPGLGSGYNNRTNTGGPAASFGIWHEYIPEVLDIAAKNNLKISRIHTHVGSGSDWKVWQKAVGLTIDIVREFSDVEVVNLGGGYKIDRMNAEKSIDLQAVFEIVKTSFDKLYQETGRKLHLEIEPGTYLAANSCLLVAQINDIADTGKEGFHFIKTDASMTELLRPMIYGAKHPIRLLGKGDDVSEEYVVVGCCCESGDIFTPKEGEPEQIDTVRLPEASIGDYMAIMSTGAYGIAMSAKNYNSRPICAEVMILASGEDVLISKRQEVEDIWDRELCPEQIKLSLKI